MQRDTGSIQPSAVARRNGYAQMLRYALPYRARWIAIIACTLLGMGLTVLQPWPMQVLIDNVLGGAGYHGIAARLVKVLPGAETRTGGVAWVVVAGLLIFAVSTLTDIYLTRSWARLSQRMTVALGADLFAALQRRSLAFHRVHPVGDMMSRIGGDAWAVNAVVDTLLFAPAAAMVTLVIIASVMVRLDAPLAVLSLAVAPLMATASLLMGRHVRGIAKRKREAESRIETHVHQTLSGIPVVQAFAQESREHDRFLDHAEDLIQAHRKVTLIGAVSDLAAGLITTLGTGAVLWYGALHVLSGRISLGTLLVFLGYLRTLQTQVRIITGTYTSLQSAGASVDRVMAVLNAPPEVPEHPGAIRLRESPRGHLQVRNVTAGYREQQPVLVDVSLEVKPGRTLGIVGPTGTGKSTLALLISRLMDPWSGQVLLDGRDVRDLDLHDLRRSVALVSQEPNLFKASIARNIAYGKPHATDAEIRDAARRAGADEFIVRLSEGYDTEIGPRGGTLSGGQRQRLAIARALLVDAPILVLDEPTAALDALTERDLLETLAKAAAGRTTLIAAHRLSTIRSADEIIVIENGRITEQGTHDALIAHDGLYAKLWRIQSGEHNSDGQETQLDIESGTPVDLARW
jgi:ATP-binding cassette subfamily B protein/subfamily B ATP-binding cassette protein MsbA